MKHKILKLVTIALLFAGMMACKDKTDDLFLKVSPDSQSSVIEKELNGIIFKFCLLNEQGKPATIFRKGENFSFYFSVTNKTSEKLLLFPGYAYTNTNDNEFCEVFTSDNQKIGKPFIFLGYDKIGIGAYSFDFEENYVFEQQWIDQRNSTWRWKYGYYESCNQTFLPIDNYFTEFQYHFQFQRADANSVFLDTTLKFKINFQIK